MRISTHLPARKRPTPPRAPHRPRLAGILAVLLFAGSLGALAAPAAARAADPACQPLVEASRRQVRTPTHIYATETAAYLGGKPRQTEIIQAGDALYIHVDGRWQRSPVKVQALRDQQEENAREGKGTCRYLRDEAVNGEAAAVYLMRSDTEVAKVDSTVWISRRSGLPLRTEMDMDVGGTAGKSHKALRYEYRNVQPPPL
jgi:hypothetical protein